MGEYVSEDGAVKKTTEYFPSFSSKRGYYEYSRKFFHVEHTYFSRHARGVRERASVFRERVFGISRVRPQRGKFPWEENAGKEV